MLMKAIHLQMLQPSVRIAALSQPYSGIGAEALGLQSAGPKWKVVWMRSRLMVEEAYYLMNMFIHLFQLLLLMLLLLCW